MSWKNTDPLELWKTSTTLPITENKIKRNDEVEGRFLIIFKLGHIF